MKKQTKDLPYNAEAEMVVLGSTLISKDALYKVLAALLEDDFYIGKHQLIYRAIISLENKHIIIDVFTITEELVLMKELENVGGVKYLKECTDKVVALSSLEFYINIVKDNSDLRRLLSTIRNIDQEYKTEEISSITEFIQSSEQKIRDSVERSRISSFKPIEIYTNEAILKMQNQKASGNGHITGISCGYSNIDAFTNGFQRGEVTILGARTSVGKTALALNMAYRVAFFSRVPVAIFELEMTGEMLAKRMISLASNVSLSKITSGELSKLDEAKVSSASKEISELPIFIDDSSANTLMDIENKSRQLLEKYPTLGLIVVDHMSIVKVKGGKKNDTRVDEMRKISSGLHDIAKELNVAVLAVAQVNRDSVKGEVRRPKMSDIKESGAIEQDADVIILLFDQLYENSKKNKEDNKLLEDVRHIEAIIAKQRNGRQGIADLFFFKQFSRYDIPPKGWQEEAEKYRVED